MFLVGIVAIVYSYNRKRLRLASRFGVGVEPKAASVLSMY